MNIKRKWNKYFILTLLLLFTILIPYSLANANDPISDSEFNAGEIIINKDSQKIIIEKESDSEGDKNTTEEKPSIRVIIIEGQELPIKGQEIPVEVTEKHGESINIPEQK